MKRGVRNVLNMSGRFMKKSVTGVLFSMSRVDGMMS